MILEGRGLCKTFQSGVVALDKVDIAVDRGETLAVVGESGSGKSTLARIVMGLLEADAGTVHLEGEEFGRRPERERRPLRRKLGMVFQDPGSSLNPRMTVRQVLAEPFQIHRGVAVKPAESLVEMVGLSQEHLRRYPHELSGGQKQRVAIARALALDPILLVLDEPTSALDVSVQAQILNLLSDLQRERTIAYLFITHDLDVVRHVADRIAVMYRGQVVEHGPAADVLARPEAEYTRRLLASVLHRSIERS